MSQRLQISHEATGEMLQDASAAMSAFGYLARETSRAISLFVCKTFCSLCYRFRLCDQLSFQYVIVSIVTTRTAARKAEAPYSPIRLILNVIKHVL